MISIILPNLNTNIEFLKIRLQSIFDQTYLDWECVVVDGFSTNGSWEYLKEHTMSDGRFKLYQKPKRGIYNAWNEGLKLARGEFIYVATSDDTMEPDMLEKMVEILEDCPSCGIAHCCLSIIDERGSLKKDNWDSFYPSTYFGDLMKEKHIRLAPHDGILHAFIKTVYTSITQLVIRRSVFNKTGLFIEDGGSIADFEWGMKAGLMNNVVHLPEYLAAWRIHDEQATTHSIQEDPKTYKKLKEFVVLAYEQWLINNDKMAFGYNVDDLLAVYDAAEKYYVTGQQNKRLVHRIINKFKRKPTQPDNIALAKAYATAKELEKLIVLK